MAAAANGAIYQAGHDVPLFENAVARRVGDMLTITLEEKTAAPKSASTSTAKKTKVDMPGPTLLRHAGAPCNGRACCCGTSNNKTTFDGSGDSAQSNQLHGDITVTVAKRLANGNLLVRGQKWIAQPGREYVRIQGIVRPVDIGPDNSVPSYKVADAQIAYGGAGRAGRLPTPRACCHASSIPSGCHSDAETARSALRGIAGCAARWSRCRCARWLAERVKDVATVAGVRSNQLVGYGLVVGLDGTGDQTSQAPFTVQSINNMLAKFGVTVPANVNPQLKNVAAVTVTADAAAVREARPDDRRHGRPRSATPPACAAAAC